MSDYADKLTSGDQPAEGPAVVPEPKPTRCEITAVGTGAPEIEDVAASLEEKRLHDQAADAIEREHVAGLNGDPEPLPPDAQRISDWRVGQAQAVMAKRAIEAARWNLTHLCVTLKDLDAGHLSGEHNASAMNEVGGLYLTCLRTMAELARLNAREFDQFKTPLLSSLPEAK